MMGKRLKITAEPPDATDFFIINNQSIVVVKFNLLLLLLLLLPIPMLLNTAVNCRLYTTTMSFNA